MRTSESPPSAFWTLSRKPASWQETLNSVRGTTVAGFCAACAALELLLAVASVSPANKSSGSDHGGPTILTFLVRRHAVLCSQLSHGAVSNTLLANVGRHHGSAKYGARCENNLCRGYKQTKFIHMKIICSLREVYVCVYGAEEDCKNNLASTPSAKGPLLSTFFDLSTCVGGPRHGHFFGASHVWTHRSLREKTFTIETSLENVAIIFSKILLSSVRTATGVSRCREGGAFHS